MNSTFVHCCLTIRSTGPSAAGRHLGFKSLAQMPTCRNGPVSSNVRPHIFKAVPRHRQRKQNNANALLLHDCKLPKRDLAPQACQAARNKLDHGAAARGIKNREVKFFVKRSVPNRVNIFQQPESVPPPSDATISRCAAA